LGPGGVSPQLEQWLAEGAHRRARRAIAVPGCGSATRWKHLGGSVRTWCDRLHACSRGTDPTTPGARQLRAELVQADVLALRPAMPLAAVYERLPVCIASRSLDGLRAQLHAWLRREAPVRAVHAGATRRGAEGFIVAAVPQPHSRHARPFPAPLWNWPKPPYRRVRTQRLPSSRDPDSPLIWRRQAGKEAGFEYQLIDPATVPSGWTFTRARPKETALQFTPWTTRWARRIRVRRIRGADPGRARQAVRAGWASPPWPASPQKVTLYRQGEVNFIINASRTLSRSDSRGCTAQRLCDGVSCRRRGPGLCTRPRTRSLGFDNRTADGLNIPAIKGIGDSLIYFR